MRALDVERSNWDYRDIRTFAIRQNTPRADSDRAQATHSNTVRRLGLVGTPEALAGSDSAGGLLPRFRI